MLWRKTEQGVVQRGSGSEYLYSWEDWENLSALWEKTLNRAWGEVRDEPEVIGRVTAKVVAGASLSLQSEGKGRLGSKGQGCCRMASVQRLLCAIGGPWTSFQVTWAGARGYFECRNYLTHLHIFQTALGLLCRRTMAKEAEGSDAEAVMLMAAWTRGWDKVRG